MKTMKMKSLALVLSLTAAACGDDGGNNPMIDAAMGSDGSGSGGSDAGPQPVTYVQIEQLARPGIAEALLLSNGFLAGYNATAPTFTGVPAATLGDVVAEAKTVLKAIYLGTCLINGVVPGLTATSGAKPAGVECAAIGGALFTENNALTGVTLTQTAKDGAQAYADRVFSQFIPDVMRIDTALTSTYFSAANLCNGAAANSPLLCGGRKLDDDVIDITYFYLLAGATVPTGLAGNVPQALALVNDGVSFAGAANNPNQGHPAVSATFPYSAPPI